MPFTPTATSSWDRCCQTFHYTAPNNTARERRAFVIHFMTPGTTSRRTGEHLAVSFARPMLRMRV